MNGTVKIGPGDPKFDDAVSRTLAKFREEPKKPAKRASERSTAGAKVTPRAKALSVTRETQRAS